MEAKLVDHLQAVGHWKMYNSEVYKIFRSQKDYGGFEGTPSNTAYGMVELSSRYDFARELCKIPDDSQPFQPAYSQSLRLQLMGRDMLLSSD